MPVTLKDAKISVKLDLDESERKLDSFEDRVKDQRKEEGKEEKRRRRDAQKARGAGRRGGRRGGALGGALAGAGLSRAFRGIFQAGTSVPWLGIVAGATLAGMTVAELNERFGPAMKGFIEEALPGGVAKLLPLDTMAEMASFWPELKSKFTSIGQAFDATRRVGAAIAVTGGELSPELVGEIFGEERAIAIHRILLEKRKRRLANELIGGALGKAVRVEADKIMQQRLAAGMHK